MGPRLSVIGIISALYRHSARGRMKTKKLTNFKLIFSITPAIAANLMRIEAVRQAIELLPIPPRVLVNDTYEAMLENGDRI